MKIIKLTAENIKKLVAIEITPDGNVIKITGRNGAGKTSVLDSIFWALGGLSNVQPQPIRKGEQKARIELDLGDLIVERKFTDKTNTLHVTTKDGARYQSPQKILDKLIGQLSFDPLSFMRMDSKQQFDELRKIVGIDFDVLNAKRKKAYEQRRFFNQRLKEVSGQIKGIDVPDDTSIVEKDTQELLNQIQEGMTKETKLETVVNTISNLENRLKEQQEAIEELKLRIKKGRALRDNLLEEKIDISTLKEELAGAEVYNTKARLRTRKNELLDYQYQQQNNYDNCVEEIKGIDNEKKETLAKVVFPLPGLTFENDTAVYMDVPLEQLSSAEQLRVSLAIAMHANPKLRVIRITDGSLLDKTSMKIIEQMAEDQDYQVWIECIDESGKVGVVIEEGCIKD